MDEQPYTPSPKRAAAAKMLAEMADKMGEISSDADKLLDMLDLRREMMEKKEEKDEAEMPPEMAEEEEV